MPELPEVETICCDLRETLIGKTVATAELRFPTVLKNASAQEFSRTLAGKRLIKIGRRGKFLLFYFSNGWMLVGHLGMTGKLQCLARKHPMEKHTHAIIRFKGGQELRFVDPRRFGGLRLIREQDLDTIPILKTMGPEPLSQEFSPKYFAVVCGKTKREIKAVLLDQAQIAGVGNIYACEALFRAGIHPARKADTLSESEAGALRRKIREVIKEGIRYRGTSVSDYVDLQGNTGSFQRRLKVYSRENEPCRRCKTPIARIVQGGRSSFYCPKCQPMSK